jgi:hypothetical protein
MPGISGGFGIPAIWGGGGGCMTGCTGGILGFDTCSALKYSAVTGGEPTDGVGVTASQITTARKIAPVAPQQLLSVRASRRTSGAPILRLAR